jgi:maleate isomerase
MSQAEALKALGVKRFVGVTYVYPGVTDVYHQNHTRYFTDAGFDVLAMEGLWAESFAAVGKMSSYEIYAFVKKQYKKFKEKKIDGIYMLGSFWRCLDVIQILEEDMGIPVVHPVPARVWALQKRLAVRQRVKGFGRLLEEMP